MQSNWNGFKPIAACLDIPAFRIVEIKDSKVTIDLVSIDEANLADDIARFNTKIPGFHPVQEARKLAADWSLLVSI